MTKGEWQHGPQAGREGWVQDPDGGWHQSQPQVVVNNDGCMSALGKVVAAIFLLLVLGVVLVSCITYLGSTSSSSHVAP